MRLQLKRVYEPPADIDGMRILVDRLWAAWPFKGRCQY